MLADDGDSAGADVAVRNHRLCGAAAGRRVLRQRVGFAVECMFDHDGRTLRGRRRSILW